MLRRMSSLCRKNHSSLQSPRSIVEYLDQYVIGQGTAKKVLAVSVFNHYQRIRAAFPTRHDVASNSPLSIYPVRRSRTDFYVSGETSDIAYTRDGERGREQRHWINPSTRGPDYQTTPTNFPGAKPLYRQEDKLVFLQKESEGQGTRPEGEERVELDKSNVLLVGPSGSGKTLLSHTLSRILDVPFAHLDATALTQAGYVGDDVETCVIRLLQNCNWQVDKAEQGIVFIDEIDKIARCNDFRSLSTRDIGGEGVQQSLLKILEGTTLHILAKNYAISQSANAPSSPHSSLGPTGGGISCKPGEIYKVNTKNILFVLSGAFIGLDQVVANRLSHKTIGFSNDDSRSKNFKMPSDPNMDHILEQVEQEDLIKYGIIPEFVGRVSNVAVLTSLDEKSLIRILVEPKNALLKQYRKLFEYYQVKLHVTEQAVVAIAQQASKSKTGARGLRRILDKLLLDAMYRLPDSRVSHVVLTSDIVYKTHSLNKELAQPLYFADNEVDKVNEVMVKDRPSYRSSETCYDAPVHRAVECY